MSKLQCPVCRQRAEGRKAQKKIAAWLRDARLDRFMYDKLMLLAKAWTQDQRAALDREKLREEISQEIFGDRPVPAPGFKEATGGGKSSTPWYAMAGYAGGELLQPVKGYDEMLQEDLQRHKDKKKETRLERKRESNRRWLARHPNYSRDYYQRQKALRQRRELPEDPAEAEDALGDNALDRAEKQNEKLARDREYQRKYYAKNKERIDRLRKERVARQAGTRRSPNTGAKANGH